MTLRRLAIQLALVGLSAVACLPAPEPAIDQATVIADNASVRMDASSGARTIYRLSAGTRVDVIEKRGSWRRIRDSDLIEGWMEESTLLSDQTLAAMQQEVERSASQPAQNTVIARDVVNLRLAPGRETEVIRRLPRSTRMEVIDRAVTPRPNTDATDVWLKVRPSEEEIGWVYEPLVEFEVPEPLRPFTEGRLYAAVLPLRTVEDAEVGAVTWQLVAERRPNTAPEIHFDGIRVFTWNLDAHRYETSFRTGDLRGVYPVEVFEEGGAAGFRIRVLDEDGHPIVRQWLMRGTIPREVR